MPAYPIGNGFDCRRMPVPAGFAALHREYQVLLRRSVKMRGTASRPAKAPPHQLSAAEAAMLRKSLLSVAPLSEDDLAALPMPTRVELRKGAAFLRAGERAAQVGTIVSGALREYYVLKDGTERTRSFNLPGEFAGSLSDLLSDEPARTTVVAEAPTVILATPWDIYQRLTEARSGWQHFARIIAERLYRAKSQREYELLALDASARYRLALQRWPNLESLFTQRDIASYIGITPVHLSRLRATARKTRT